MKKLLLLPLLFITVLSFGQGWFKKYGGVGYEYGGGVQQTTDGGYIFAGITNSFGNGQSDVYLIKTDSQGDTVWTNTYGGSGNDYVGSDVQQTTDGGYVIAGSTNSFGNGGYDIYIIKTDSQGDTLWTKTYGSADSVDVMGRTIQQTTDGGYIIVGNMIVSSPLGGTIQEMYILKTDSQGDTLWTKTYDGTPLGTVGSESGAYTIRQTTDGGYIIGGGSLLKTDSQGDSLWTKTFSGSCFDGANTYNWIIEQSEVQQTTDGGFIIAGNYYNPCWFGGNYGFDIHMIKTDSQGDTLWTKIISKGSYDQDMIDDVVRSVQQTTDGGYIFAGYTHSEDDDGDVYLIKTDSQGDTLWTKTYGGPYAEKGHIVRQTTDGGYIISGSYEAFFNGGPDLQMFLIKTNGNGDMVWINELDNSLVKIYPNPSDGIMNIELNDYSAGKVVLTDMLGKEVLNKSFTSKEVQINLKSLASKGTYFAKVIDLDGNVIAIKKLIYQ